MFDLYRPKSPSNLSITNIQQDSSDLELNPRENESFRVTGTQTTLLYEQNEWFLGVFYYKHLFTI